MIILTDLSDVLIEGLGKTASLVSQRFGGEAGIKCWHRIQETEEDFNNLMRGKMSEKDYYRIFFKKGDLPFTAKDISRFFSESFRTVVPGTLQVYQRIVAYPEQFSSLAAMKKGMPDIYIVSDHIAERVEEIKGYHPGIFAVTKGQFWSFDLGRLKRDPHFFQGLLQRLNVGPNEVVFIDDNPINTEMAARAGIANITFTSANALEKKLREFGFVLAPPTP